MDTDPIKTDIYQYLYFPIPKNTQKIFIYFLPIGFYFFFFNLAINKTLYKTKHNQINQTTWGTSKFNQLLLCCFN